MSKIEHDSATPAPGQQVISAVAFIHRKVDGIDKVFLPKREKTKAFLPDMYEMVGGHIDFGEDIIEGLKREIMEELSMKVSIGDPFACFTYENKVKGSHSVETVYFGKFIGPIEHIKIDQEDHSEFGWFSKSEVIDMKDKIIPPANDATIGIQGEDPEYLALLKGFELLEGSRLNFN